MKSVQLPMMNKRFDDQYTFDLQHYLSRKSFCSTINLFNQAAHRCPPPGSKAIWLCTLWVFWMLTAVLAHIVRIHFKANHTLIPLLLVMVMSTALFVWGYRRTQQQFEFAILEICSQVNATQNIRGVNYRLSKNGHHLNKSDPHQILGFKTSYAIVIEFDDRYSSLPSQRFSGSYPSDDYVSIPLCSNAAPTVDQPPMAHLPWHHDTEKNQSFQQSTVFPFTSDEKKWTGI
ncbi:hypothetical protein J3Q64DRAFT_1852502 [Phycomyces blakesleeanus]|uniref:Uncharacterized protein n=1 Tax=Phycomyces blakesleeanus TaxID=4837 RepID=A0ABR3ALL0_PHYBL